MARFACATSTIASGSHNQWPRATWRISGELAWSPRARTGFGSTIVSPICPIRSSSRCSQLLRTLSATFPPRHATANGLRARLISSRSLHRLRGHAVRLRQRLSPRSGRRPSSRLPDTTYLQPRETVVTSYGRLHLVPPENKRLKETASDRAGLVVTTLLAEYVVAAKADVRVSSPVRGRIRFHDPARHKGIGELAITGMAAAIGRCGLSCDGRTSALVGDV